MSRQWVVLWSGWVLFLVAQILPAVIVDMGAWNHPTDKFVPGWFCTIVSWPFFASNLLALGSPLLMWFRKRYNGPVSRCLMTAPFVASLAGALLCIPMFRAIHIGFVLWCMSFGVIAGAILIPDRTSQQAVPPYH